MYEKVNPSHPDKVADRIAGAMLDLAYKKQANPKCAIEVLLGHNNCHIINETSCHLPKRKVKNIVYRIVGKKLKVDYLEVSQDSHLANNQSVSFRCGDNGIFKGVPTTKEQRELATIAKDIYSKVPYDGKYIIDHKRLILCQSNCAELPQYGNAILNPIGYWTGGEDVDAGATNRKLGSDMGDAVTGGGLCGKDLSKADVSVNIYCHLCAQESNKTIKACCAIGDKDVKVYVGKEEFSIPFSQIVDTARKYIEELGGFEKFAEWGLIR